MCGKGGKKRSTSMESRLSRESTFNKAIDPHLIQWSEWDVTRVTSSIHVWTVVSVHINALNPCTLHFNPSTRAFFNCIFNMRITIVVFFCLVTHVSSGRCPPRSTAAPATASEIYSFSFDRWLLLKMHWASAFAFFAKVIRCYNQVFATVIRCYNPEHSGRIHNFQTAPAAPAT